MFYSCLMFFRFFVYRNERTKEHPRTPTKNNKYSRRAWDGLVKVWRKKLHLYDNRDKLEDDDQSSSDV